MIRHPRPAGPAGSSGRPSRPRRGERGVALIELSIVVGLLTVLVFGIITYGVTLSFKQSLTQAANDGVRAGAVAPRDLAVERAEAAVNRAAESWGVSCGDGGGLTCEFPIEPCAVGTGECMTIELRYDLEAHPRVPTIGPVEATLPDEMVVRAVVEVSA